MICYLCLMMMQLCLPWGMSYRYSINFLLGQQKPFSVVVTTCDAIFMCVFFWLAKYLALLAHKVILKAILMWLVLLQIYDNLSWRLKILNTWYSFQKNWFVDACIKCAFNPKNMIDFLTFNNIMIEDNNKFIKDKRFLERTLIYFEGLLVFFCFDFVLFSLFVKFSMFFSVDYCLWVCNKAKGHMKVWKFLHVFFLFAKFQWWNGHVYEEPWWSLRMSSLTIYCLFWVHIFLFLNWL
jgi:hypothetical protein